MVRLFYIRENGELNWEKNPATLFPAEGDRVVWVDMHSSTEEEKKQIESQFKIELFTPQEAAEIESSSSTLKTMNILKQTMALLYMKTAAIRQTRYPSF